MNHEHPVWDIAPTTYEQLMPRGLRRYATGVWTLILLVIGGIELWAQIVNGETEQIGPWFFMNVFAVLLPGIIAWVRNQHLAMDELLDTFVDLPLEEIRVWTQEASRRIISGDWRKWLVSALVAGVGLVTLTMVSLPRIESEMVRTVASVGMGIKLFFAGALVDSVIRGLRLPARISQLPVKATLYQDEYTGILSLSRLFFSFSVVASFIYLIIFGALTTGPYGMSIPIMAWLLATGLLTGLTIPISTIGLHRIMERNKREALSKLGPQLDDLIKECIDDSTPERLAHVQTALQFRHEIARMPEWPIRGETLGAVFTSLLLPIVAIVIEILT